MTLAALSDSPTPWAPAPTRVVDVPCFHCGKTTRIHQQRAEDAETKYWREKFEQLMCSLNGALETCQMLHGDDPMRIGFERSMIELRERFCAPVKPNNQRTHPC